MNSSGISEKLGILYVLAAWVSSRPRCGPSRLVPEELLQGQPAHPLDEPALDLAEVDQRRQAVTHVVHDVRPGAAGRRR